MFRQLHCDKIHSFHSATSFLLVTIVSLMPNWRQCLISTEWVKRCRCPELQNHMLRVKGPRPHKAQLLHALMWPYQGQEIGGRRGREVRIHRGPHSIQTPRRSCWQWRLLKSGSGFTKGWASQELPRHSQHCVYLHITSFIVLAFIFIYLLALPNN